MSLARPWNRFWYEPAPLARLAIFRVLFAWLALYDLYNYAGHAIVDAMAFERGDPNTSWNPIYLFEVLGIRPPPSEWMRVLFHVELGAVLCVMFGLRTRTACLVLALLAFYSGGLVYSATKVRHDRVAFTFASFALAFSPCGARLSLDSWLARRRARPEGSGREESAQARWPLRLVQASLALGYGFAGIAKVTTAGWFNGYTFQGILLGHDRAASSWVAARPELCQAFSVLAVGVELGIPLLLVFPRLGWILLPGALAFHAGTWATMDTGPYMTLWFLLIAFVPLERIGPSLRSLRNRRRGLGVLAGLALAGICALVLVVILRPVPAGLVLALLPAHVVALALAGSRPLLGRRVVTTRAAE